MGKKILLGIFVVFAVSTPTLFAEFNRSSVLIDIPTAYVLRHKVIQGTASGSFALSSFDQRRPSYDFDFMVGAGIGDFLEISASAYTLENYALGITALILKEDKWYPSLAVGMHEITWVPYIGSYAGNNNMTGGAADLLNGDGDPEDQQIDKPGFAIWEQQEWFSAFVVASKQLGDYFRIHAGIGRGRYTGYEGLQTYFNTDVFNPAVSDFAFGFFGALEFNYRDWFSISAEYDGRDINFGSKLGFEHWEIYLAATHLEQLMTRNYFPRLSVGLNIYTSPHRRSGKGATIGGDVKYPDSSPAVGAKVEAFTEHYNQVAMTNEDGAYKLRSVPLGEITVVASTDGYRSKPEEIEVTSGSPLHLDLNLVDISNKGRVKGMVRDVEEGSGLIANVYVLETGDAVRAGPRGGAYEIVGLEPAKYTLHAEAKGYFDHEITCKAQAGEITRLNINMSKNWIIFHFKPGEKMIEQRYMPVLEDVVRFLNDRPNMVVEIQGHTDSVGDAKDNRELSRRRAEAVRDFLVKQGINSDRLVVKGYGELSPIGDNRTVLGRDMNRRVELRVLSE